MLLGAFIWALPDPKYQFWLKGQLWIYYILSILNMTVFIFGMIVGAYFYMMGPALYSFLSAALVVYLLLATGPLLLAIVSSFLLIQVMFYNKPQQLLD